MNTISDDCGIRLVRSIPDQGIQRRNRLNQQQTSRLMEIFEQTTKPRTEVRRTLAKELGMRPRAVQICFQNRRQKFKKEHHGSRLLESSHILGGFPFQSPYDSGTFNREYPLQSSKPSTGYGYPLKSSPGYGYSLLSLNLSLSPPQIDLSNPSLHEIDCALTDGYEGYERSMTVIDGPIYVGSV